MRVILLCATDLKVKNRCLKAFTRKKCCFGYAVFRRISVHLYYVDAFAFCFSLSQSNNFDASLPNWRNEIFVSHRPTILPRSDVLNWWKLAHLRINGMVTNVLQAIRIIKLNHFKNSYLHYHQLFLKQTRKKCFFTKLAKSTNNSS